jgi:hypothetical protein
MLTPMANESVGTDRIIRWQRIALDQLGYALNLVLAFAVATLGYWFALLRDTSFSPGSSAKCAMLASLWALAIAIMTGFACVLNRLRDIHGTARRARSHPDAPSREELRILGRITWWLFCVHVGTFILGVMALATALLLSYGGKLV